MKRFIKCVANAEIHDKTMTNNKNIRAQLGFSLIELIIVIAIMSVLIGLLAPAFSQYVFKNKQKACKQNREAILAVYQRCVFDSSVRIELNEDGLKEMIPSGSSGYGLYGPIAEEVLQYGICPLYKNYAYSDYGVEESTGTAWIKCSDCDNIVSVDMTGWSRTENHGADDAPLPTMAPTPTPIPEDKEWTVSFNLNGHGYTSAPADQTVMDGDVATKPSEDPKDYTYEFQGWFTKSSCAEADRYTFGEPVHSDITLYAKWVGMNMDLVWPYADDATWWDPDLLAANHAGAYTSEHVGSSANDKWIVLNAPSGIFTSRSGGQFVYIKENNDQKIYFHQASTPEMYSARKDSWLIQLSGQTIEYDLEGLKDNDQIFLKTMRKGDLIIFKEGNSGKKYYYVEWQDYESNQVTTPSEVRNYNNQLKNMRRISNEY